MDEKLIAEAIVDAIIHNLANTKELADRWEPIPYRVKSVIRGAWVGIVLGRLDGALEGIGIGSPAAEELRRFIEKGDRILDRMDAATGPLR